MFENEYNSFPCTKFLIIDSGLESEALTPQKSKISKWIDVCITEMGSSKDSDDEKEDKVTSKSKKDKRKRDPDVDDSKKGRKLFQSVCKFDNL